jgi:hypothetical protein
LIALAQTEFSSPPNESLSALKARTTLKKYDWKYSWKPRCAVAVLSFNEDHEWAVELSVRLGFPELSEKCKKVLARRAEEARKL